MTCQRNHGSVLSTDGGAQKEQYDRDISHAARAGEAFHG